MLSSSQIHRQDVTFLHVNIWFKSKINLLLTSINGDYPELDATNFLDADVIHKYQSLIGALQLEVSVGRIDITIAVMNMSFFRVDPRIGHIEMIKIMHGYH